MNYSLLLEYMSPDIFLEKLYPKTDKRAAVTAAPTFVLIFLFVSIV